MGTRKSGKPAAGLPASRARSERLLALESKLAGLQEKYTDEHPLVRATQDIRRYEPRTSIARRGA